MHILVCFRRLTQADRGSCSFSIPNLVREKIHILPLSHKSGNLCWERPLTVSEVFGDNFFEILSVFWVETLFFFFFLRPTLHGLAAKKKEVRPKKAVFDPFPEGGGMGALWKIKLETPKNYP